MPDPENALDLPDLAPDAGLPTEESEPSARSAAELAPVYDVPVHIRAVLGKSQMDVSNLLRLGRGSVIELDRRVGEAVDIYVNNRLVARGELVVLEDRLGVTMTEIIKDGDVS
jgi:flagellar motor switch protein FliN/FliY